MHDAHISQYRAWTCVPGFLLRSTGFPVEQLDALRLPRSIEHVAHFIHVMGQVNELQAAFITELFPHILHHEQQKDAPSSVFASWYQLKHCVQKKKKCEDELCTILSTRWPDIGEWIAKWNTLHSKIETTQEEFEQIFSAEFIVVRDHLSSIVSDAMFQEALLLSNPNMYDVALPSYFRHYRTQNRPAKIRHLERRFYSYLQRFCMKNDTTSFFGPIDYGWYNPDARTPLLIQQESDVSLLERWTRMSYWSVQAIADCIAGDACVQPYLIPQLQDGCALLLDDVLYVAVKNQRVRLSPEYAALLRRLDGKQRLIDTYPLLDAVTQEHFHTLYRKKIILLKITIPTAVFDPLKWLYDQVRHLPVECQTRLHWLTQLERFMEKIQLFSQCALKEKSEALHQLEENFTLVTQQAARRGNGEAYADRLLVYDEARGDIAHCVMGTSLYQDLLVHLTPIMHLYATFSLLVQRACFAIARELFLKLDNGEPIPYLSFIHQIDTHIRLEDCMQNAGVQTLLNQLRAVAQQRTQGGCIRLTQEDIQPYLETLPAGMMVSPDLFLSAPSVEALNAGDYQIIIGEAHYGAQVWCHFLAFSDQLQKFEQFFAEHFDAVSHNDGCVRASVVHRRQQGKTFYLEFPGMSVEMLGRSVKSRENVLSAADLDVRLTKDHFVLHSRTTKQDIELYPGDPRSVSNWLFGAPPVIAPEIRLTQVPPTAYEYGRHAERSSEHVVDPQVVSQTEFGNTAPGIAASYTPRIELDGVVLQRARWSFPASAILSPLAHTTESALFLHANQYRLRYGLPMRFFARVPSERKPFFIDFANMWSLELLASLLQTNKNVEFTECLPETDRWWLKKAGETYSCEWRMTFVTC